jgi:hypothetical protein
MRVQLRAPRGVPALPRGAARVVRCRCRSAARAAAPSSVEWPDALAAVSAATARGEAPDEAALRVVASSAPLSALLPAAAACRDDGFGAVVTFSPKARDVAEVACVRALRAEAVRSRNSDARLPVRVLVRVRVRVQRCSSRSRACAATRAGTAPSRRLHAPALRPTCRSRRCWLSRAPAPQRARRRRSSRSVTRRRLSTPRRAPRWRRWATPARSATWQRRLQPY